MISGVSLRMMFFLFLFVTISLDVAVSQDDCLVSSSCSHQGSLIRFPFRLKGQPDRCGYPGFELSCTERNETILELPHSAKVLVKNISYESHEMMVQDPEKCLPRQLQNLSLAASPFNFKLSNQWEALYDFTFFNCSSKKREMSYVDPIPCLSLPDYPVYAVMSTAGIRDVDLSSCQKMYNISAVPYPVSELSKGFSLNWSSEICRNCEESMKCRLKSNSKEPETECIGEPATGTISFHILVEIVLERGWVQLGRLTRV